MTVSENALKEYLKRKLGSDVLCVELTPKQLDDAIDDGILWFSAHRGVYRETTITLAVGTSEYNLETLLGSAVSDKIAEVVNIWLPAQTLDQYGLTGVGYLDLTGLPLSDFDGPSARLSYSDLVQRLQFRETARRILNAEISMEFSFITKVMRLMPAPEFSGTAYIEYKKTVDATDITDAKDERILKDIALAYAKQTLGRIRSKYSDYEMAGGSKSLDGDTLLAEASEDFSRLKEDIQALEPIPFITG